jgi:hypothetical protein
MCTAFLLGSRRERYPEIFRISTSFALYGVANKHALVVSYLGVAFATGEEGLNSGLAMWVTVGTSIGVLMATPLMVAVFRWKQRVSGTVLAALHTLMISLAVEGALRTLCGSQIRYDRMTRFDGGKNQHTQYDSAMLGGLMIALTILLAWKSEQWQQWVTCRIHSLRKARDGAFVASCMGTHTSDKVLAMTTERLRRVAWKNLTLEVFTNKVGHEKITGLSEPCGIGDIDFFISHSWSDDPRKKVDVLNKFGAAFYQKHGRMPYAWLDTLCIDQNNRTEDIQCLPAYLMSCNDLLVLCGPTYATRLWCLMELYIFIAMTARGRSSSLDLNEISRGIRRNSSLDLIELSANSIEALMNFQVDNAQCSSQDDLLELHAIIGDRNPM